MNITSTEDTEGALRERFLMLSLQERRLVAFWKSSHFINHRGHGGHREKVRKVTAERALIAFSKSSF